MKRPEYRADNDYCLAPAEAEAFFRLYAQQVKPHAGKTRADEYGGLYLSFEEYQRKQRCQNGVQVGEKAGTTGGFGDLRPDLLECGSGKQYRSAHRCGDESHFQLFVIVAALFCGERVARTFFKQKNYRNERERSEPEAYCVEGEGVYHIAAQYLSDKGKAPDDCCEKEKNVCEDLFVHGDMPGVLSEKLSDIYM